MSQVVNSDSPQQPESDFSPAQLKRMETELRALIRKAELYEKLSSRQERYEKRRRDFAEWKLKHRIPETPEQYWARIMRVTQDTLRKKK